MSVQIFSCGVTGYRLFQSDGHMCLARGVLRGTVIKFVKEEKHVEDFQNGRLFLRSLRYFVELDQESDGRGDRLEGIGMRAVPDNRWELTLGGVHLPISEEMGFVDVTLRGETVLNWHALCFYMIDPCWCEDVVDFDEFKECMKIPNRCVGLGQFAIVVIDYPSFHRRVLAAAEKIGAQALFGPVGYFDSRRSTSIFSGPGFWKSDVYKWQREWRFLFDSCGRLSDPDFLDVGDLRDITRVFPAQELNDLMEFKFTAGD